MSQPIKLSIPSNPKYLGLIRKVLQELLQYHEVPDETARRLILCVDEACSNVIKYSYEGSCENLLRPPSLLKEMISRSRSATRVNNAISTKSNRVNWMM